MTDKIQPKQVQPSLTELAEQNKQLAKLLDQYTETRNFVYGIVQGEIGLPKFVHMIDDTRFIELDLSVLSQELVEGVLFTLVERAEFNAFEVWKEICKCSTQANSIITEIKSKRKEADKTEAVQENTGPDVEAERRAFEMMNAPKTLKLMP